GEDLDVTNLTIEVTKSDGSKETVNVDKSMVKGFDSSAANPSQELTITYEGKTTTYTVKIEEEAPPVTPTVTGIAVNSTNHKTEYKVGEDLDVTNLTIEVTKSDGSKETVNVEKTMVKGFDSSAANPSQELTITYEGQIAKYTVKIEEEAPPTPTTYNVVINPVTHGKVKADKNTASKGEVITLTIVADAGYEVESIEVKDGSGNKVPVTNNTFVMPESDVKVNVSFRAMPLPPTPPTPSIPDDYERPHRPYRPYRPYRPSYEDKDDKREEKTEEDKKEIETKVVITIGSNQLDKDINGINNITTMDAVPYIKNGRTMLPIRYVAEALGLSVDWIKETRTVIIQDMFFRVEIPVDTNLIIVNGVKYESDVKPEIVNGRTMLPVANIARALGLKDNVNIFWDAINRKVTIIK
uniref:stalk domain-containing protein n=1 Tax=uncultured Fenollaria sp. TaxID=1686315 RepID=UPI0025F7FD2C